MAIHIFLIKLKSFSFDFIVLWRINLSLYQTVSTNSGYSKNLSSMQHLFLNRWFFKNSIKQCFSPYSYLFLLFEAFFLENFLMLLCWKFFKRFWFHFFRRLKLHLRTNFNHIYQIFIRLPVNLSFWGLSSERVFNNYFPLKLFFIFFVIWSLKNLINFTWLRW